jgi:hypothetical protein
LLGRNHHNSLTVAILGGNPGVGRTLEVMLKGAGYDARYLNGSFIDKPAELPAKVRLVLLTPGLYSKGRERLLNSMMSASVNPKIPILELITASSDGARTDLHNCVLWPCRVEDLKREIEATLLSGSEFKVAGL